MSRGVPLFYFHQSSTGSQGRHSRWGDHSARRWLHLYPGTNHVKTVNLDQKISVWLFKVKVFSVKGGRKEEKINGLNQNIQLWIFQSCWAESEKSTRRKNSFKIIHSFTIRMSTKHKYKTNKTKRETKAIREEVLLSLISTNLHETTRKEKMPNHIKVGFLLLFAGRFDSF